MRRRPRAGAVRAVHLGTEHRAQVEERRSAVLRLVGPGAPTAARIAAAPPGYLLAHDSGDIARHCELLEPLAAPGEVRAVVTPGRASGEWFLDVASRDRPGLLAAFTGVLAAHGLDVVQAIAATWDDGGALEAFVVRAAAAPGQAGLQGALEASLDQPLASSPVAGALVAFDDSASPLYTRCDVTAPDRPGLLHDIALGLAVAGADVHAARVVTVDGVALDRFDLSDRQGRKLCRGLEGRIRAALATGVPSVYLNQMRW